jgi:hypothetical protein
MQRAIRRIFPMLLECHLQYSCLYTEPVPPALEIVAPYLVQLDYEYRDTRRFLTQAWGNSWGIFLKCDASLNSLRRHLRGFLVVGDPNGGRLVFRYYDPRVSAALCRRLQVRCDAGGAKAVAADFGGDAGSNRAALEHHVHVGWGKRFPAR